MMEGIILILVLILIFTKNSDTFTVHRDPSGDLISGDGISDYCSISTSCKCKAGETFFQELPNICTSEVPECTLKVAGATKNIFEANSGPGYYYILDVVSGTSTSVCAPTFPITLQPILVRDFQNTIMMWNLLWQSDFSPRIRAEVIGTKVRLTLRSHWSGLLMKIYLNCGMGTQCLALKFQGELEYPLTYPVMSSLIGPLFPLPSEALLRPTPVYHTKALATTSIRPIPRSSSTIPIPASSTSSLSWSSKILTSVLPSSPEVEVVTTSFTDSSTSKFKPLTTILVEPTTSTKTLRGKSTTTVKTQTSTVKSAFSSTYFTTSMTTSTFKLTKTTAFITSARSTTLSKPYTTSSQQKVQSESSTTTISTLKTLNSTTTYTINVTPSRVQTDVSITTSIQSNQTVSVGRIENEDDHWHLWYILIAVFIILLIIWLLLLLWCCRRRKRRIFKVKEDELKIIETQHKSVLSLHQSGSLSSAPAILNTHGIPRNRNDGTENKIFEFDTIDSINQSNSLDDAYLDIEPIFTTNPLHDKYNFPNILNEGTPVLHRLRVDTPPESHIPKLDFGFDSPRGDLMLNKRELRSTPQDSYMSDSSEVTENRNTPVGLNGIIPVVKKRTRFKRGPRHKPSIYDSSSPESIARYISDRSDRIY